MKNILTELHAAVRAYRMPKRAEELVASSDLLLLCGVTAAGKNTISHYLVEHNGYETVVSHTTRSPRVNHGVKEQNGVEYWFVNEAEMLELVQKQAFVEVKLVHGDTVYGTSIDAIGHALKVGKTPLMEIDVQGALELGKAVSSLRPMFILPPSYEVWMLRLGTRGFISDGDMQRRMESAKRELQTAIDNPSFLLVVNTEVEQTAQHITSGRLPDNATEQEAYRSLARELLAYLPD